MEVDNLIYESIDWAKIPDILKSRENSKRMTKLLELGEENWIASEKEFILEMENAIIKNFTQNYGYTEEQAKAHVLKSRERLRLK